MCTLGEGGYVCERESEREGGGERGRQTDRHRETAYTRVKETICVCVHVCVERERQIACERVYMCWGGGEWERETKNRVTG